jgi:enoyl-CoA hydratase/carnithine racemase
LSQEEEFVSEPVVIYEKRDHVAVITLNRPEKLNAYNAEVLTLESEIWADFRDDPDLYVAILTGAGEKSFCAGADLSMMNTIRDEDSPDSSINRIPLFHMGHHKVYKPIIAAINGYCVSGGLAHALMCDIRIAAEHSRFAFQQVKFAAVPSVIGTVVLPKYIGLSNALYMILTAKQIDAETALRWGLIHEVVPADKVMDAAWEMAETILLNSPSHMMAKKEGALRGISLPIDEAKLMAASLDIQVPIAESKEGTSAFLEKRKPDWSVARAG